MCDRNDNVYRDILETEMKQNKLKVVRFSSQSFIYPVEQRSELSSEEKSNTWYTSEECHTMAKKAGIEVLLQSKDDENNQNSDDSIPLNRVSKREETRGLEQYLSMTHYQSFKNSRRKRIKSVLEAQRALRSYGVKDHSWAIHVTCAKESLLSSMKAVSLGLSDQAAAFEIYREG